jgi:hypothetical protein
LTVSAISAGAGWPPCTPAIVIVGLEGRQQVERSRMTSARESIVQDTMDVSDLGEILSGISFISGPYTM